MSMITSHRAFIPLAIGLAVGSTGTILFLQSMPGAEGSQQERADKLEVALKKAENRAAALEGDGRRRPGRTLGDGMRDIAGDIRDGRPVTPDDILRAAQPLLRDLAPLFDRMRVRQQQMMIDSMTGELSRKHNLTPLQQEALKKWFEQKSEQDAKEWTRLVTQEGTSVEDLMRASRDVRPDDGLDAFMETTLSGEKLAAFKSERLTECAERVQAEADRRVQRLDTIVELDDGQRDQVFGIMARNSRDYDPAMQMEGTAGAIGATPGGDPQAAMLSVLRPEQREAYDAERQRRREEAAKDLEAIGLSLPPAWDLLDEYD